MQQLIGSNIDSSAKVVDFASAKIANTVKKHQHRLRQCKDKQKSLFENFNVKVNIINPLRLQLKALLATYNVSGPVLTEVISHFQTYLEVAAEANEYCFRQFYEAAIQSPYIFIENFFIETSNLNILESDLTYRRSCVLRSLHFSGLESIKANRILHQLSEFDSEKLIVDQINTATYLFNAYLVNELKYIPIKKLDVNRLEEQYKLIEIKVKEVVLQQCKTDPNLHNCLSLLTLYDQIPIQTLPHHPKLRYCEYELDTIQLPTKSILDRTFKRKLIKLEENLVGNKPLLFKQLLVTNLRYAQLGTEVNIPQTLLIENLILTYDPRQFTVKSLYDLLQAFDKYYKRYLKNYVQYQNLILQPTVN